MLVIKINVSLKMRQQIYLGKGVSAAYSAAFWGVPTEESELQLSVWNYVPTKVTLFGIGFDTLVQGEVKPFLRYKLRLVLRINTESNFL